MSRQVLAGVRHIGKRLPQETSGLVQRVTLEPVRSSEIVVEVFPDVAREHAADIEDHRFRRHYLVTPMSASGSQVASSGNAVMIARQRSIMRKKGSDASAT